MGPGRERRASDVERLDLIMQTQERAQTLGVSFNARCDEGPWEAGRRAATLAARLVWFSGKRGRGGCGEGLGCVLRGMCGVSRRACAGRGEAERRDPVLTELEGHELVGT